MRMGFARVWVEKVMDCVRTKKYMVKCNANLTESFSRAGLMSRRSSFPLPFPFLYVCPF